MAHKDSPPAKAAAATAATKGKLVREETIPLVEERVRFDRREVKGRTVSVTTRPVTETVSIAEPVRKEDVTIERVPVGRVVETAPPVREEGDLTVIPVLEERITVTTELVLTEEIHLRRTAREEMVEQKVELRRTEIDIEGTD